MPTFSIKHHLSRMSSWVEMVELESLWFWHMLLCGLLRTTGFWSMFPVHTNGLTIEKPNIKELTMVFTWYMNTLFNGLINSKLVMNTFFQRFKSNLNFLASLISLEPTKKNTNLFPTFGMKEEKFTLMISTKSSNSEWMKQPNSKKKNNQLWEWQTF